MANRPRLARWSMSKHQWLALIGGISLFIWGLSGLAHIVMVLFGPQQAEFMPPPRPVDMADAAPVEQVLADSSATLNETRQLMLESQQLVKSLDALVGKDSTQALPAELQQSLLEMRKTLNGFSAGSPVYERINSNLQAMDKVLRDLQPVVQTLNQQSNALILGADPKPDPEPQQGNKP